MAFLQIQSDNPNFSFILKKNPSSGMQTKSVRKGIAFGYYSDEDHTYNIFFKDAANEISYPEFKDQEFEYTNTTRYASSLFVINAISDFVRDALKKQTEHDVEGYSNTVILNMMLLENQRVLSAFKFHFNDVCTISEVSLTGKYYRITFNTKKPINYLLNMVNLFASFIVMKNESEYLYIDEETVEKYFQSLQVIDAPYFIRYSFKTDLLRGPKLFDKYKPLLETSSRYPIRMVFGDTIKMRYDWVASKISTEHNIVDVGCGSGKYVFNLAPRLNKGCQYIAIDTDPDIRDSLNNKVKIKELSNVVVLDNIDAVPTFAGSNTEPIDFLLTEVLEHMPLTEAMSTLQKCLNHPRFNAAYITTPNKDFNPFYFDSETQLRHSEHIFEFTECGFIEWLQSFDMPLCVIYCPIGDIVDGKPTTLGAIVTRKEVVDVI